MQVSAQPCRFGPVRKSPRIAALCNPRATLVRPSTRLRDDAGMSSLQSFLYETRLASSSIRSRRV